MQAVPRPSAITRSARTNHLAPSATREPDRQRGYPASAWARSSTQPGSSSTTWRTSTGCRSRSGSASTSCVCSPGCKPGGTSCAPLVPRPRDPAADGDRRLSRGRRGQLGPARPRRRHPQALPRQAPRRGNDLPTLGSTLIVETLFDTAVAGGILAWALFIGVLPGAGRAATWSYTSVGMPGT